MYPLSSEGIFPMISMNSIMYNTNMYDLNILKRLNGDKHFHQYKQMYHIGEHDC